MSLVPHPEKSPSVRHERFSAAYAVLQQAIAEHAFPGCTFGVLSNGEVLLQDSLGQFTYETSSPAVTPVTLYDIASVSKVVATTAAAMLLHQRGLLDLDTPLGEILPGFIIGRDVSQHGRRVTLRHLLAHSSGLPGYVPLFHTATTPYSLLRACLELPIQTEPGTAAEYSDPGFILLGNALEAVTGEHLSAWVQREIFRPLAMSATRYCPPPVLRPEIPPTENDELFRQRILQGEVQDEHAFLLHGAGGHAGVFSNVPDLLTFAHAVLNPGPSSLFHHETIELFAQRQPPPGSSRALGWDTPSENSSSGQFFNSNSIGHLGYSGCSLWIDRESALAIVLLTNRTWPDRESQLIRTIRPAFHDAIRRSL